MTRRGYTAEFNSEAAKLMVNDGYSLSKASAAMDVGQGDAALGAAAQT